MRKLSERSIRSLACLAAGLFLMLTSFAMTASAARTSDDFDLTTPVTVKVDFPVDGATFRLYRVADITSDGSAFALSGEFARFSEALPITEPNAFFSSYVSILTDYTGYYGLTPDATADVEEGSASFTADADGSPLMPGVYLALTDGITADGYRYEGLPTMFCTPYRVQRGDPWQYDVEIDAKWDKKTDVEYTWLQATKRWENEGEEDARPKSIKIALMCDGALYEEVELSGVNRWTYKWENLDGSHTWSVVEIDVPENYALSCDNTHPNQPILVNTFVPPPSPTDEPVPTLPPVPQTGMLWWPVPVLFAAGLALFVFGLFRQRRDDE